jgi:hypothetical protein
MSNNNDTPARITVACLTSIILTTLFILALIALAGAIAPLPVP